MILDGKLTLIAISTTQHIERTMAVSHSFLQNETYDIILQTKTWIRI